MSANIRGLTLHRPWQSAFLLPEPPAFGPAPKRVENRGWWPKWATAPMRDGVALAAVGEHALWLALHAGQHVDAEALCAMHHRGVVLNVGRAGEIVAVCRLARVLDVELLSDLRPEEIDRHHPWICGPYAWEVDQFTALPEPVTCRGAQGLWHLRPAALEQVLGGCPPLPGPPQAPQAAGGEG